MKFLILWELGIARLSTDVVHAVMRMPEYAQKLSDQGKLEKRYHIVGKHGGAWIYDVASNEELERLLAMATIYNWRFARWPRWSRRWPAPPTLLPLGEEGSVPLPAGGEGDGGGV